MFYATDAVSLGDVRVSDGGYLEAFAKTVRTGCQTYLGAEVGKPELSTVTVYRDEREVFSKDSLESFRLIPVTIDHPPGGVSAKNWRNVARGTTGAEVLRDGEYLRLGLRVKDEAAVAEVRSGKCQLSAGYRCELQWGDGIAPDGTHYQARQVGIVADHIAIVSDGRAGPQCRIGDSWTASDAHDPDAARDAKGIAKLKAAIALHAKHMNGTAPTTGAAGEASQQKMMDLMIEALKALGDGGSSSNSMGGMDAALTADISRHHSFTRDTAMKTHMIGDNAVEMSDAAIVAVKGLQTEMGRLTADNLKLTADLNLVNDAHTKALSAKDGEILKLQADHAVALEAKDKQIADLQAQAITADKLDAAVAERSAVMDAAKPWLGADFDSKGKTVADIRKATVAKRLGDKAVEGKDDAHIAVAFDTLTALAPQHDALGRAIGDSLPNPDASGRPPVVLDSAGIHAKRVRELTDAWKQPPAGAA
jgi:hypothetical protein